MTPNHFLPSQERAASTLDKIEAGIDLICPVDRHVDNPGVVLVNEWDVLQPGQLGSLLGGRHPLDRQSGDRKSVV